MNAFNFFVQNLVEQKKTSNHVAHESVDSTMARELGDFYVLHPIQSTGIVLLRNLV